MRNIFLTIIGLTIISLGARGQVTPSDIKGGLVIIEKVTLDEITDRKIRRLKKAKDQGTISDNWNVEDFRVTDKSFDKEYQRLINGLKKKGIKFIELDNKGFSDRFESTKNKKEYFLTYDHSIKEDGKFIVITRTFMVLTTDKQVLLNDSAKDLLKKI